MPPKLSDLSAKAFHGLGSAVARRPLLTILVTVLATTVASCCMLARNEEFRIPKLYSPSAATAHEDSVRLAEWFHGSASHSSTVLLVDTSDAPILRPGVLAFQAAFVAWIRASTSWSQVCQPPPPNVTSAVSLPSGDGVDILRMTVAPQHGLCAEAHLGAVIPYKPASHATASTSDLAASFAARARASPATDGVVVAMALGVTQPNDAAALAASTSSRLVFPTPVVPDSDGQVSASDASLAWQSQLMETVSQVQAGTHPSLSLPSGVSISGFSWGGLDADVHKSSSQDFGLVSFSFTIMITFATCSMNDYYNTLRSHGLLGMLAVVSVGLGIGSGFGLAALFGIPWTSICGVVPFGTSCQCAVSRVSALLSTSNSWL